jgi:ATP-dependent 26S proteasome regulatory subunit
MGSCSRQTNDARRTTSSGINLQDHSTVLEHLVLISIRRSNSYLNSSQVARCTKIINAGQEDAKYIINVKQIAKFVVGLGERVAPTDIEEGMRVG